MNEKIVKIKSIAYVTHDVLSIVTEKPSKFEFTPGQATEIAIYKVGWEQKKRPFTFTSLPTDKNLEFTIKTYPSHQGVTNELRHLRAGDKLILHEVFGAISYQGPGLFIAGGAGVTPFIAIFRHLKSKGQVPGNKLLCSNKSKKDIILEKEFSVELGKDFVNTLTAEKVEGYMHGYITGDMLISVLGGKNERVYLCGPPPMMETVEQLLVDLKVDRSSIVKEIF